MRFSVLVFLVGGLASCSPTKLAESVLTTQERAVIRGAIDDVARNDIADLQKRMAPELAPKVGEAMPAMTRALPPPPLEVSVTTANWTSDGATRQTHAVYQVKGKGGWALIDATTRTSGGRTQLTGLYVQATPSDPKQANEFSLSDAGAAGWTMLAAMVAALAVTIAALVRIWRSGRFRRRWLWTIGTLVGVTTLKMNWATGALGFQPISLQILSISAFKQPIFAPWILGVSVPAVALFALFYRGHGGGNGDVQERDVTSPDQPA